MREIKVYRLLVLVPLGQLWAFFFASVNHCLLSSESSFGAKKLGLWIICGTKDEKTPEF